ncbi:MAG: hypothetical protein H5U09_06395 [Desulfomicrobiaceae bacterium]|jgi:hypothetical protein|nr:hypothetical protein [Desulfomicrobiaceae bacterium]
MPAEQKLAVHGAAAPAWGMGAEDCPVNIQELVFLARRFAATVRRSGFSHALAKARMHPVWQRLVLRGGRLRDPFVEDLHPLQSRSVAVGVARQGNQFMELIARQLACGLEAAGQRVVWMDETDVSPARECDTALVVAPHEFFVLGAGRRLLGRLQKTTRLVCYNTEQPGSQWLDAALPYLRAARQVWDMNFRTAVTLRANGIPAAFVPLGHCPAWSAAMCTPAAVPPLPPLESLPAAVRAPLPPALDLPLAGHERPIDILFVGTISPRRSRFFARAAATLARFHCVIYLPEGNRPFTPQDPRGIPWQVLAGLALRSKIVLNVHRAEEPYLEWQRVVTLGLECGAWPVTETSMPVPGLLPGRHYQEAPAQELADLCRHLLEQGSPQRLAREGLVHWRQTFSLAQILRQRIQEVSA